MPLPAATSAHRVQRLVVELSGVDQPQAGALQTAVRQRLQHHLLPMLDSVCARLGDASQVQRIDALTIDLGTWPADAWLVVTPAADDPLGTHAEAVMQRALAQALQTAVAVQADAELVASVLHSGHLPWWADPADSQALRRALAALLAQTDVATWLPDAPADSPAWQRLVHALNDADLARLARRVHAPASAGPARAELPWADLLARVAAQLGGSAAQLRRQWWPAVLCAATPAAGLAGAWSAALAALPGLVGQPAAVLAAAWRRALDQTTAVTATDGDTDAQALAPLWHAVDRAWPPVASPQQSAAPTAVAWTSDHLQAALRRLAAAGSAGLGAPVAWSAAVQPMLQAWAGALAQQWPQLPPALQQPLLAALAGRAPGAADAMVAALQRLLQALRPPPAGAGPAAAAAATVATALAAALHTPTGPAPAPLRSTAPAPAEALTLANAGLVLMWPFLPRFAERLGLLDGKQFVSAAHAARAALLLQRVATGTLEAPEFQLPLNKLLCGLPLDQPLAPDAALGADDETECDDLLRAVISAAPVLRQMSLDGFRASFLMRHGQLRTQDGHWLVQVERQTHDLVMDRFPWSAGLLRLPWMPRLLQVQW